MAENSELKDFLFKLRKNLNILQEREAKYAGNAPLDLLNQIEDHQTAIKLTEQAITGQLGEADWREALKPMLISLDALGSFFGPAIPFQRPPRVTHFTNRKGELTQLLADLQPGQVATLCGPGGIGKTALATEALQDPTIINRFPDGIIFYSFYGHPDPALALEHIVTSYNDEIKPMPVDAARRVLAGKQALLVLDGAEEAQDLAQVLEVRGGCGVLVTSRHRKDAPAERQDIKRLAQDDAVVLLRAWGQEQVDDQAAAEQICELIGGLPLAVRLVGRYLAETEETAREYLEWLNETPLTALDQGQRRADSVPLLLECSLVRVSEAAKQVLAVVGLLALAPFRRDVVAAALPEVSSRRALGELVSYGLLLRQGERYEMSHALIHTYAQRRLTVPGEVVSRLAAYYDSLAREQRELGLEGYTTLDVERGHLMAVMAWCGEKEEWETVRSLVWALEDYLNIQGYWTELLRVLEAGLIAARELDNRGDEGSFLGSLGSAYRVLGQVEQAIEYYEQALAISREIDDRQSEGNDLSNLGLAYHSLGKVEWAVEYYEQALVIAREIGDRRGEGIRLGNLGSAHQFLGQVERAIEYYEQALAIAREIGDRQGEGNQWGNLGSAHRVLGQVEQAIKYYEQALAIAREIGDRRGEGIRLGSLGTAYQDLGQMRRAIDYLQQALVIAREIGDRRSEGNQLGILGSAYRDLGQVEQASDYLEQALVIAREIGDRRGEGIRLGSLGTTYQDLGQVEKAIEYYKQALVIDREIGYHQGEGADLGNLGNAYRGLSEVEKAIEYYEQALVIFEEIKSPIADVVRERLDELDEE